MPTESKPVAKPSGEAHRAANRRPRTFDGLELSLKNVRARLEVLERLKVKRETRLAEVVGRRLIGDATAADAAIANKAIEWLKRQISDDNFLAGDAREIVEDFLSSLQSRGDEHG